MRIFLVRLPCRHRYSQGFSVSIKEATMPRHFSRHLLAVLLLCGVGHAYADVSLLNVSYDPTRELYQDFNTSFAKYWLSVV